MANSPAYDVFVSYAEADRAWVEGYLLDALMVAGVRVHSEAAFALGAPLLGEFEHAVQSSERTLLVLSPAYLTDDFSRFSDLLAQTYGLETSTWPVIPLILHPVELPPRLAILTPLDATDPLQWAAAVARLGKDLQHPAPKDASASRPPCPYPGMVPYSEGDQGRFFGRDEDTEAFLHALHVDPFVTVIGPSGSGKSSLVFAGLVPALRNSTLFGEGPWEIYTVRPGARPLEALETGIVRRRSTAKGGRNIEALIKRLSAKRCLLVVDQFEELFTVAERADADAFQKTLGQLIEIPGLYMVLTVRADFYAELMVSPLWPQISGHRMEVLPLDEAGLRQAILRPAEASGVYVESALVERLGADAAGEPGMLPLLQETLVLLWEHLERRYLPLRAYETLVLPRRSYKGIAAEPSGLQVAMARRADAAYAHLGPEQRSIAQRTFLRLVHFGEGRADTRRQQSVHALRDPTDDPQVFERTIRLLAQERLLTLSGDEQRGGLADLAHEALIAGWPMLQEWLVERREAEVIRRRLDTKAEEWSRLGRGSGGLLDEAELPEADRWLGDPSSAELGIGQDLLALIEASRVAIEAKRLESEATRQRELDHAHSLAEAERGRAEDQALAAGRLRRRLVFARVALAIAVIAASTALFAFSQATAERERAEDQTELARVRALAGQSSAQLQLHNDELASLLALQAWNFDLGTDGEASDQVDMALRQTASTPYFSRVLSQGAAVQALAFHPEGTMLAIGDRQGRVRVWNLLEPAAAPKLVQGAGGWVTAVAFSPDGETLAFAATDGSVSLYSSNLVGSALMNRNAPRRISSLTFSDDALLATVVGDPTSEQTPSVYRWSINSPDEVEVVALAESKVAQAIVVDPSQHRLVAGIGIDDTVRLWELDQLKVAMTILPGQKGWTPIATAFDTSGRSLVAAGTDGSLRLWSLDQPGSMPVQLPALALSTSIAAVSMDSKDRRVAAITADGAVVVWALDAPTKPDVLLGHANIGITAAFSPDGKFVATGGGGRGSALVT